MLEFTGYLGRTNARAGGQMLSERERQQLELIEADLSAGDRQFVVAMRRGRPRPPREYRRTWAVVLAVLGLAGFVAVLVTGHWAAVVGLAAVAVVAVVRFVSRRLDSP
jgi:Flp pilus assembly protein TadB